MVKKSKFTKDYKRDWDKIYHIAIKSEFLQKETCSISLRSKNKRLRSIDEMPGDSSLFPKTMKLSKRIKELKNPRMWSCTEKSAVGQLQKLPGN